MNMSLLKKSKEDLWNSILQYALQGKLTKQLDTDSSVDDLLEKIKVEKEELIKEKKIKKEKSLSDISDDEKPFDIPENWRWSRLGLVGIYKKGPFGSSLTKSIFVPKSENAIKVYEQKNAIQKDITLGDYYITKEYYEEKMKGFSVEAGDIIVSCAGTIGETFVVPKKAEKGIINQALMKMNITKYLNLNYFLLYFDHILKESANKESKGSAIKNIPPFEIFKAYLIPIPPIEEQKRIVEKLEKIKSQLDLVFILQDKLKESKLSLKDSLLQAAMQGKLTEQLESDGSVDDLIEQIKVERQKLEAEGKIKKSRKTKKSQQNDNFVELPKEKYPYDVPNNWSWTTLNEITISNKGQGLTKNDIGTGEIPAILYGQLYTTYSKRITNVISSVSEKCVHKSLQVYKDNIILPLTSTSPKSEIGKGIVYYSDKEAYLGSDILCLKHFINSDFLALLINSPKFNQLKMEYVKGITIKHLNIDGFLSIPIAIPPIEEQQRIVEILDKLLPLCEVL